MRFLPNIGLGTHKFGLDMEGRAIAEKLTDKIVRRTDHGHLPERAIDQAGVRPD